MERQLGGICRVTPFSPLYPLWLGRTHLCLELSFLQNRRPTIPIVTAPSLAGVNSQDARCHLEGGHPTAGDDRNVPPRFTVTGDWVLKGDPWSIAVDP